MSSRPEESWPKTAADLRQADPALLNDITQLARRVCWSSGVRDENQIDDVTQEVILRLQQGRRVYPDRRRLFAYVSKVARGFVTQERRRTARLLPLEGSEADADRMAWTRQEEALCAAIRAVDKLPNEIREVMRLWIDQVTIADIAKRLGMSKSTVYRHIVAGKESVAAALKAEGW